MRPGDFGAQRQQARAPAPRNHHQATTGRREQGRTTTTTTDSSKPTHDYRPGPGSYGTNPNPQGQSCRLQEAPQLHARSCLALVLKTVQGHVQTHKLMHSSVATMVGGIGAQRQQPQQQQRATDRGQGRRGLSVSANAMAIESRSPKSAPSPGPVPGAGRT